MVQTASRDYRKWSACGKPGILFYELRTAYCRIDQRGAEAPLAIDNRGAEAALAIDDRGAEAALAIRN